MEGAPLKTKNCEITTEKTTKAYKFHYQPRNNLVVAHFMGANGLHTFDLRKTVTLREYFNFHYY